MRAKSTKLLGLGGSVCLIAAALAAPTYQAANAADLSDDAGSFSGSARNYGVFAGVGLFNNTVNARANVAESVTAVNSDGLGEYAGTGVGELAVPGDVANDPQSRAYSRAAPIGAGFTGLNLNPVRSQSVSTTVIESASDDQDFGTLDLRPIGTVGALTGSTSTQWTDGVLRNGGLVSSAQTNTGEVQLVPDIEFGGAPVPGLASVLPLGRADLGQNTNTVTLVPAATASCPTALAVETTSTWKFADVQLFGGNVGVSWGGESGADDTGTITARATGTPDGASLTVSQLPTMTVQIGGPNGRALTIEPGLSIELSDLFAGSDLGSALARIVDGQLTYGGTTNREVAADGTRAAGSMNGLNADLTLLPVPIIAPAGLGSAELGFERVDVDAAMSPGGLNCASSGGSNSNANASATGTSDASSNANANANANSSATGTSDSSSNANASSASDASANSTANGTSDASSNGASNSSATGTSDSSTNGTSNSTASGTSDASANSSANGTSNSSTNGTSDASSNGASNSTASGTSDASANSSANGTSNSTANGTSNGASNASATGASTASANGAASGSASGSASGGSNASGTAAVNGAAGTAASAASDDGAGSNVDGIAVGSSQKRLATTGMEQTWPVGIAAALALTAGGLWMVALRRRRTRSDEG